MLRTDWKRRDLQTVVMKTDLTRRDLQSVVMRRMKRMNLRMMQS